MLQAPLAFGLSRMPAPIPYTCEHFLVGASDYWLLDWCQWFRHHHSLTYISVAPGGPNMIVFCTGHGPRVLSCLRKIDCKACGDICFAALHPFHLQGLASTPSSIAAMSAAIGTNCMHPFRGKTISIKPTTQVGIQENIYTESARCLVARCSWCTATCRRRKSRIFWQRHCDTAIVACCVLPTHLREP